MNHGPELFNESFTFCCLIECYHHLSPFLSFPLDFLRLFYLFLVKKNCFIVCAPSVYVYTQGYYLPCPELTQASARAVSYGRLQKCSIQWSRIFGEVVYCIQSQLMTHMLLQQVLLSLTAAPAVEGELLVLNCLMT
jgi:hypothetical protein